MLSQWLTDLRWRKTKRFSGAELRVILLLLPKGDARSQQLYAQAVQAPSVERRHVGVSGYEAMSSYAQDTSNLIDLDFVLTSPSVGIPLGRANRIGRFNLTLAPGGYLHSLSGMMVDGSKWERDWTIDESVLSRDNFVAPENWLPPLLSSEERANIFDKLGSWLGIASSDLRKYSAEELKVYSPSSDSDIAELERREGLELPDEYASFLRITNGLAVGKDWPVGVDGTRNIGVVAPMRDDAPYWLVTDLNEDGGVVMSPGPGRCELFRGEEFPRLVSAAASLKSYILDTIRTLDDPSE